MVIKINISRKFDISYKKLVYRILEENKYFTNLDKVNHLINPKLEFTETNILKKRELIFKYPVPKILNLIVGDLFVTKVMETSVINNTRCSVNCVITINTLLGDIKLLETGIYNENGILHIELTSITKNFDVILDHIAKIWKKDRKIYLEKILK